MQVSTSSIEAVVFDWAGTLVDFGSFAPTKVLVEAFAQSGIQISLEQARGPMGRAKWEHIQQLCALEEVSYQFVRLKGRSPKIEDIDHIYETFLPLQIERVGQFSDAIPGAAEVLHSLKDSGIRIGSCTGYPRAVLKHVLEYARKQQIVPDVSVACDEVKQSRPGPGMLLSNFLQLGITDVARCVKVDDTPVGILEGRHAGCWTVGLSMSGNNAGLTLQEYQALSKENVSKIRARVKQEFEAVQPHYLIDTIADLPSVLVEIQQKLRMGIRP